MDKFWAMIAKDVGQIPEGVKVILGYAGYINGALAELGDPEITAFEDDITKTPYEAANEGIKECFAKFQNNPQIFRIVSGMRALLKILAAAVKKNGINHYLKPVPVLKTSLKTNSCSNALTRPASEQSSVVIRNGLWIRYSSVFQPGGNSPPGGMQPR